jgi:hypothetical protein
MQLVYDFLYKRHSPTFLIFLYTGHSDYPVDSDYPLKYSIPTVPSCIHLDTVLAEISWTRAGVSPRIPHHYQNNTPYIALLI